MSLYSLHPSYAYEQSIIDNLASKTGRSLTQWQLYLKAKDIHDESMQLAELKTQGLGSTQAQLVIEYVHQRGGPEHYHPEQLVNAMFSGKKSALRPLYEMLLREVLKLGSDVKVCPCKTIVPCYREHVFAQLKPATNSRLELGLALRGEAFSARLQDTGGSQKNDRITHRIALHHQDDVDLDVLNGLRRAYGHG